ncbi:hypothetical protein Scep_010282 [Stephania cephalantha]|uniref:Uncharacterized protein n=1 Tax=Stephania cephalantha TaxID=152367 RepID=A0AAP0JUQ9_9MAGN
MQPDTNEKVILKPAYMWINVEKKEKVANNKAINSIFSVVDAKCFKLTNCTTVK